ncbi:MAG: Tim44/TimA family putative adaptor protein [Hyphomicrobiaceae bacterium]
MDGRIDLTTLLFLVLAIGIFLKLRSVLGRRTGDERTRYERLKAQQQERRQASSPVPVTQDKVVTLPKRETEETPARAAEAEAQAGSEEKMREFAAGNAAVAKGLIDILRADMSFDPDAFLKGARAAYEIIVTAFAEGNRKALKDLLSRDVFEGFANAIGDRESRGEQVDQSFVGIKSADLVEAELRGTRAHLTVKFVSELISARRDRNGTVVDGDPRRIREVTDVWTFARDVNARTPNWELVATQAAG